MINKKVFILLCIIIISYIFYIFFNQSIIEKNQGLGWDGIYYNSIYQFFKGVKGNFILEGNNLTYEQAFKFGYPFNQRIGTPFLAYLLKFNEFLSFKIINLLSFFGGLGILFYKWSKKDLLLSIIFTFFMLLTPQLPFRLTLFYPINVEGILFLYIALVIYFNHNSLYILLFTILFLPFKETTLLIGGMYFITIILYLMFFYEKNDAFNTRRNKIIFSFISLIIIYVSYMFFKNILRGYLGIEIRGDSLKTIIFWVKQYGIKWGFPVKLLACIFTVFGGFWFFYFMKIWQEKKVTKELIFMLSIFPILIFSGSDITRILCILLPFLLDSIIKLDFTKIDYRMLIVCFVLFVFLKYPFLILQFDDNQNIGEGFFITQLEYLTLKNNVLTVLYSSVVILILYLPIFKKYILNNDKIFRLTKN